jgi:2-hydroxychromene-2-carboxylate isomerase
VISAPGDAQPIFFYDLGSPACYIVAERIMSELSVVPEWEPVLAASIGADASEKIDRGELERRARDHGLQPLRWPGVWPPRADEAMLAATYAKRIGRAVAFSLAAFRQTFAGGRDLGDRDTVLIAAAACEMHPTAVLKGMELRATSTALELAADRAGAAGVTALPAIAFGEDVFTGIDAIEKCGRVRA